MLLCEHEHDLYAFLAQKLCIRHINQDFFLCVCTSKQAVNDRADDPDARPMLYDPLQGGRTTKTQQYLATVIGMYFIV